MAALYHGCLQGKKIRKTRPFSVVKKIALIHYSIKNIDFDFFKITDDPFILSGGINRRIDQFQIPIVILLER